MAIFRAFFIGVLCWTVCMPVFEANGAVTQTGQTQRTSNSNSVDSSIASYSSGANSGGGASSASCSKSGEKCEVKKNGKTVGNGICNNKVCVAKECTEPYYLEHYTVVSDKNNGFKCSISGQKVITGISEYGDDVQVCGSKGICRTREQAKKANKCSVDAALLIVNGKTVIAGCQSIEKKSENCTSTQILKENACVDCPGCENVANGACKQLNSRGNVCQYETSCNDGYEHQSGTENTNSPICNPKKLKLNLEPEDEDEPDVMYQIKYELDGGKGCELVHGLVGNEIECVPTKDEFDFGGWCYDTEKIDCAGSDGKFTVKPGKTGIEITMYAKWSTKGQQSQDAQQRTECSEEEKAQFPHAIKFEFADGKCWVSVCETGYKLENGICVDDGIQEAEDKYKDAKEKEQSKANRMLGGLTMAATGIGGMELAQGLSEQKADKDAEADMSRYIETFQCKIGEQGAKINGGDTNISTPGANQLINLYQEYVNLAADLRERKQALGMRAGIESEVILDKASTGLYDDKGNGIENGTYASLYRASQGNQQDADKLSALKDTSKKRVIGGAIAAGVGVIGGIVGNLVINKDKLKNEISTERENIKSQYNNIIAELVDECNKTIQSHKDFIATLTPKQLENKDIADYKQDVEAAQFVHTLSDIKESLFCK